MIQGKLAELYVDIVSRGQIGPALAEVQGRARNMQAQLAASGTVGWSNQLKSYLNAQNAAAIAQKKMTTEAMRVQTEYTASPRGMRQVKEQTFAQKEAEIQAQKLMAANLSAQNVAIASPQGTKLVKEQIAAQKAAEAEQKKLNRTMDIASLGKFGAGVKQLREGLDSMGDKLSAVGGYFGIFGAAATGAVAAASPDAFKTFTMSLQYLAASVGQALLPAFVEIIRWIQTAARWFQDLDPATKRLIGTFAGWSIAIGGLAFAGARLIAILSPMLRLLQMIAGLRFGGALFGLGGAIGAAAMIGETGILGGSEDGTSRMRGGAVGLGMAGYMMGLPAIPALAPFALAYAMSGREGLGHRFSRAVTGYGPDGVVERDGERTTTRTRMVSTPLGEFAGELSTGTERTGPAPAWAVEARRVAREEFGLHDPGARRPGVVHHSSEGGIGDIGRRAMGLPPGEVRGEGRPDGLMLASNFQSQFVGIEQQWKSLQQMAASDSPLEAEMRRLTTESRDALVAIAGHTSRIAPGTPPTRT